MGDESPNSRAPWVALNPRDPGAAAGLTKFAQREGFHEMCFFQTSGSEGVPKWVGLEWRAFEISARAVNAHFEVGREDHWLIALPLYHVGGFGIAVRARMSGSRMSRFSGKWQAPAFAAACSNHGITITSLVPAQVHDLVQGRVVAPGSVRAVIVGGGGMTQKLAEAAMELGWPVFQTYGMTEAASQIAAQPYNTFGAVFDATALEVLPHWHLTTDDEGRLTVRGDALARGYASRDATGQWRWQPIDQEAGLLTRDRVKLWWHGTRRFLQFIGRESGQLKILGELVQLSAVQEQVDHLAAEMGWAEFPVVVPLPDARRETRLVLAVPIRGRGHADALLARYHAQCAPICRIESVRILDEIPRSALGKVEMTKLQAKLQENP